MLPHLHINNTSIHNSTNTFTHYLKGLFQLFQAFSIRHQAGDELPLLIRHQAGDELPLLIRHQASDELQLPHNKTRTIVSCT